MPAGVLKEAAVVRMSKLIEELLNALPGAAGPAPEQAERIRETCHLCSPAGEHRFKHRAMRNIGAKQGDGEAMRRTH